MRRLNVIYLIQSYKYYYTVHWYTISMGKGEKDKVYEKGEKEKFRNGSYKAGESGWLEEVSVLVEGGLSSLLLPRNIS